MRPSEYLDALRVALDLPSDYALAARFNVTRSFISKVRNHEIPLTQDMAKQAAALLPRHRGLVLLDMEVAKAKTREDKETWQEIAEGFHAPLPRAKSGMGHRLPRW